MYKRRTGTGSMESNENGEKKEVSCLTNINRKKWVRYNEGAELYSMGIHTFMELAKEAKAVYHVKRIVLVNTEKLDAYIEVMCADDPTDF